MEKKFNFSDKATISKIVYVAVIAILCISAIVVGIVVANNRKKVDTEPPQDNPSGDVGETPDTGETPDNTEKPDNTDKPTGETVLTFVSPTVGTVAKSHSTTVPVFSNTLDEWRIHTGIDITTEEGAEVVAAEAGEVSAVFNHPMLGMTVEITHSATHKSIYSNLDGDSVTLTVGARVSSGDVIGRVGDTAVIEIADEPHLHFELLVGGVAVNPLDYITETSKETNLGIVPSATA